MRTPKAKPSSVAVVPVKSREKVKPKRLLSTPTTCLAVAASALLLLSRVQNSTLHSLVETKAEENLRTASELARIQTEFDKQTESQKVIQARLDAVKKMHLNRLVGFVNFVSDNPRLSNRIIEEAISFAESNELDTAPLLAQKAALPQPRVLPMGTRLDVLDMQHSASTTTVDVSVVDSTLVPVRDLSRVDFSVSHQGAQIHPVRVEPTMKTSGSHRVSFLVDCSSSFAAEFQDAKLAGKFLINELANPWRIRVVRFSSDVQIVSPWSFDPEVHLKAIDGLVAEGATSLFAVMEADAREHTKFGGLHSTVILTDGKDSQGTANVENILKLYQQSATRIHVLALDRGDIDEPLLRKIATATDGSFQKIGDSQQLAAGFKAVAERMKRPAYRFTILGPIDRDSLSIQLANESEMPSGPHRNSHP